MLRDFSDTFAFVKVVQEGGFSAAALALRVPKARVSRKVQELERRLGTRLLNRTTRTVKLTEAGAVYFQHCEGVMKDLEDAENAVAQLQEHPRGWLRITAAHWLANHMLRPVLSEFRRFYPDVHPQLLLGEDNADLVADDIDIAFRTRHGELPDSTMVALRLGGLPMGISAAPSYLERVGAPQHPSDLIRHASLVTQLYFDRWASGWPLSRGNEQDRYPIKVVAVASDPEGLHGFLLAGEGLQLTYHGRVRADVAAGRLVRVLPDWDGPEPTLYALRPSGRVQPPKVKALLDFMVPRLNLERAKHMGGD